MNSRQRFSQTMGYGAPDRVPYFEEGLRDDVIAAWRRQGLNSVSDLQRMFSFDRHEEIAVDVDPLPAPRHWPRSRNELASFARRLDPNDPRRLPPDFEDLVKAADRDDPVLILRVHRGFFLSLGVRDWPRFETVMLLLTADPGFIRRYMELYGEFTASLADRVLSRTRVDAALFSEPIGGNEGPLISPAMYDSLVLTSYRPLLAVLKRHGVETIILRTYANSRILIPFLLKRGFNCLWACEVQIEAMDYGSLRREFGRDLGLIGGIDLDALRQGKEAIRREIEEKAAPLIADGGYIPLVDGRVREDVTYKNYLHYRRLLEEVTRREDQHNAIDHGEDK